MPRPLTGKQIAFAVGTVDGLSGVDAAIRAGYTGTRSSLEVTASRLLRHPKVAAYIDRARGRAVERAEIDTAWVLQRSIELVARAMQAVPVLDRKGHETGEWQYDGPTANRALDRISRYTGGFAERTEISGPSGGPIPVEVLAAFAQMGAAELRRLLQGPQLGVVEGVSPLLDSGNA